MILLDLTHTFKKDYIMKAILLFLFVLTFVCGDFVLANESRGTSGITADQLASEKVSISNLTFLALAFNMYQQQFEEIPTSFGDMREFLENEDILYYPNSDHSNGFSYQMLTVKVDIHTITPEIMAMTPIIVGKVANIKRKVLQVAFLDGHVETIEYKDGEQLFSGKYNVLNKTALVAFLNTP